MPIYYKNPINNYDVTTNELDVIGESIIGGPDIKYELYSNDNTNIIIPSIFLIVVGITFLIMIILILYSSYKASISKKEGKSPVPIRTQSANSVAQGLINPIMCSPGFCATNIEKGTKRCPESETDIIASDPSKEVCNSRYVCDNPLTPFALQSDNSASNSLCAPGVECDCLRIAQCADYITSVWKIENGSLINSTNYGLKTTYSQRTYVDRSSPLTYDITGEFCTIPQEWIIRGGCNYAIGLDEITSMKLCMNNNPCINGKLAMIMDSSSNLRVSNFGNQSYGCVSSNIECPENTLSVFDRGYGDIVCIKNIL
jgi:hypothetical protein